MKKEGAKMCKKMAKAKTTSGWRTGWRGVPLVVLQSPSSGALRGATRQGGDVRVKREAR